MNSLSKLYHSTPIITIISRLLKNYFLGFILYGVDEKSFYKKWLGGETTTQSKYVIRRKLNIPKLGETLDNISDACRKLGLSHRYYYDIKSAVEEAGLEGLLDLPTGFAGS